MYNIYIRNRGACKGSESPGWRTGGENSEVHLLPAFVLPPRGVEDEKRQRRKRKKLMPVTTNIEKRRQEKPSKPWSSTDLESNGPIHQHGFS